MPILMIIGIVYVYLVGVFLARSLYIGSFYNHFSLYSAEKAFVAYGALWFHNFEREWEDVIRQRKNLIARANYLAIFSWITVITGFIVNYTGGNKNCFLFILPPMPDKETFKKFVEESKR